MAVRLLHRNAFSLAESLVIPFPRRETSGSISGKAFSTDAQLKSAGGSVSADSSLKDPAFDKNGITSLLDRAAQYIEKTGL